MSEEALIWPTVGVTTVFAEGDVPEKGEVSIATNTSIE